MKKIMMVVASAAMAVVLTGCGGSPASVAAKFADAVIQRDVDVALKYFYTSAMTKGEIKSLKNDQVDALGKKIDDNKLEATVYRERISIAGEYEGYKIVNGEKINGDKAEVIIQFVRGKDKKADGMKVDLIKVDGDWRVVAFEPETDLDTSDR